MNVICLGGRTVGRGWRGISCRRFSSAAFSDAPRHLRRLSKAGARASEDTPMSITPISVTNLRADDGRRAEPAVVQHHPHALDRIFSDYAQPRDMAFGADGAADDRRLHARRHGRLRGWPPPTSPWSIWHVRMRTFGASAPLKALQKKLGVKPERVAALAKEPVAKQ